MPATKTAYIQASDTGDQLIGPKGIVLRVDGMFISWLQALRRHCSAHQLESVAVRYSPDDWLPKGLDEALQMTAPRLVVATDMFWFESQPKHARDRVACIPVDIEQMFAWFASDERALIVNDDEEFIEYVQSLVKDNPPASHLSEVDLMQCALASLAAVGDQCTDTPESEAVASAAQHLKVLAGMLASKSVIVSAGKLVRGDEIVGNVHIKADTTLVVENPSDVRLGFGNWSVITPNGAYPVRYFAGQSRDAATWLIDDPQAFYRDLLV